MTRTDPSSHITYANEAFLTSSGFSIEECLGKPQNLVRHPDMPKEAFADLWKTVKAGGAWSGTVKNRRKDGGFYWVRANVTPIAEKGAIVGYMSVRTVATRDEIRTAIELYRKIRDGEAKHLVLSAGKVLDTSVMGRLRQLTNMSAKAVSLTCAVLLVFLFVAMGIAAVGTQGAASLSLVSTMAVLGVGLTLFLANYQVRRVLGPTRQIMETTLKVLGGEIRAPFPEGGAPELQQLCRLLDQMNAKLVGVLVDTRACIARVVTGADEISEGNIDLSQRTEAQAAALEETAASMEELTSTVKGNTESAVQARHIVSTTSNMASRAGEVTAEAVRSMSGIAVSSRKIADITGVIDEIAFQTNILALNAAVEAACAGEHGRGFAVIASEVRALAQRSATAAKQIKGLITESVERVESGVEQVERAGKTINEVVTSVMQVAGLMTEIASASQEQTSGLDQINSAINRMDQATQQNASFVENITTTSAELLKQAKRVVEATAAFKFGGDEAPAIKHSNGESSKRRRLASVAQPKRYGESRQGVSGAKRRRETA